MAHGYEELETPLNLLMLYNAVANDGKMMKPYLVNSINDLSGPIETFKPQVLIDKICSDATLGKLKGCLEAVVNYEHGTGHALANNIYQIAGKTGTAVSAMDNRGYNKGNKIYQSAFMGFFPADHPVCTIGVVIQNSRESEMFTAPQLRDRFSKKFLISFMRPELPKIISIRKRFRQIMISINFME
jgi:cell division protein FtsI (penicillin-binding protein 3)